jgi:hypothetical protein
VFGGWLAWSAGRDQIVALKEQIEEERRRFQQTRHQKKYAMAWALLLEVDRIGVAASARKRLVESSRSASKHPRREQMLISVLALIRGEREDIGLLTDELQDKTLTLVRAVDEYNSHIETLPIIAGDAIISIDEAAVQLLTKLYDMSMSLERELNTFVKKVRSWRCQK